MIKIVLANADYHNHMTSEGLQLQDGLEASGWNLVGRRYHYFDEVDVPTILGRFKPEIVFVQDPRDWDRQSGGCYDPSVSFERIENLAYRTDIFKIVAFKDAGTVQRYQMEFAEKIKANALCCYYHDNSVLPVSRWATDYERIRTYHSVNRMECDRLPMPHHRKRGVVSGAYQGESYPDRLRIFEASSSLRIDQINHPGYGNSGCMTQHYLRILTEYKVHVATSSRYGFALRKIIESIAAGCNCVTNLPVYDKLPLIDDWLFRYPPGSGLDVIEDKINEAEACWDIDTAHERAMLTREHYDYRAVGQRLDKAIVASFSNWKAHAS